MAQSAAADKFVTVGTLRFHYREWGDPSSPPLVLLHGLTSHARAWDRFAAEMADRFRVLALDQRGHGETDWADAYSTELMATDLAAFADALGLGRFALVGHSMGGINAYAYTARSPETVDRLVIVDFGPDVLGSTAGRLVAAGLRTAITAAYDDPEEAIRIARAFNPRPSDEDVRARVLHNLKQGEDGRWIWRYDAAGLAAPGPDGRMPSIEAQWELLARLSCPTLIVRGGESDTLRRDCAERMVQVIPNATLVEVEKAGHSIPLDNPSGFLSAVRPFLLQGR